MYKVETIGDAYMVASGLPTVYERHAQEMSLLALELLDSVKHHIIQHLPQQKLQLRIGLHSGMYSYCMVIVRESCIVVLTCPFLRGICLFIHLFITNIVQVHTHKVKQKRRKQKGKLKI